MTTLTRRGFLKVAGAAGVALVSGCVRHRGSGPDTGLAALLPAPEQILVTPTGELYVQSYTEVPVVDLTTWQLTIDGLVTSALTLGYEEVLHMPKAVRMRTLECIGNPVGGNLIGNPIWGGFLAQELWDRVGIKPRALQAKFTAADGYQTSVDLRWITQPEVLMAYEINGEPLPAEHGFPLRILMPGLYGQKMPKWLQRIEFIDEPFLGYWESRGWSDEASIRTHSMIRQPASGSRFRAGRWPVFGIAFSGLRRITAVEVRLDDGEWTAAELLQEESPLVWTQWAWEWEADPGEHRLAVRAHDDEGFVQSMEGGGRVHRAFPDGSDGIHEVVVTVVDAESYLHRPASSV